MLQQIQPLDSELRSLVQKQLSLDSVGWTSREAKMSMDTIVRSTSTVSGRTLILNELNRALNVSTKSKEWRTLFNALEILLPLLKTGNELIIKESSRGQHFDIIQRLMLLGHYTCDDVRVAKLVRDKAKEAREVAMARFDEFHDKPRDSSPAGIRTESYSSTNIPTSAYQPGQNAPGSVDLSRVQCAGGPLSNIVAFGHREDDDDDAPVIQRTRSPIKAILTSPPKNGHGPSGAAPPSQNPVQFSDLI